MTTEPTKREVQVLRFIRSRMRRNGKPPTYQEIADRFGFSKPVAWEHVKTLERRGAITTRRGWRKMWLKDLRCHHCGKLVF